MTFGTYESCMASRGGRLIDLESPKPEDISLPVIATVLSRICRFGGHTPEFYTVAEHSVLCVEIGRDHFAYDDEILRAILLHDAAEAYVGDLIAPLKSRAPEYCRYEQLFQQAIAKRFNVDFDRFESQIKRVDRHALAIEGREFFPDSCEKWDGIAGIERLDFELLCTEPRVAAFSFRSAAEELGIV